MEKESNSLISKRFNLPTGNPLGIKMFFSALRTEFVYQPTPCRKAQGKAVKRHFPMRACKGTAAILVHCMHLKSSIHADPGGPN